MSKEIGVIITSRDDCGFDAAKISAKFNAISGVLDNHQVINRNLMSEIGILSGDMPEENLDALKQDLDQDFDVRAEGLVRAI